MSRWLVSLRVLLASVVHAVVYGRGYGWGGVAYQTTEQMTILLIYDKSGPKYHRCLLPCFLMPGVELRVSHTITEELCTGVDIVFFNRAIFDTSVNQVIEWKNKHGFKLVVDFDDHWILGPDHYLYEEYNRRGLSLFMIAWIQECDAVFVTHERLLNEVKYINSNVHILPNAIPKWGQFTVKKRPCEQTRLFWAGGITHEKDIELLRNPVKRFKQLPVKMILGGYAENPIFKKMASAYTNGGDLPHEIFQALPVEDYYHAYAECDVALIPLTETTFNTHKSNLKILEAANIGANVIVSNVHPYKDHRFVNYVDSSADWFKWVKWITDNKDAAKEQALHLTEFCDTYYNFEKINAERRQIFEYLKTT